MTSLCSIILTHFTLSLLKRSIYKFPSGRASIYIIIKTRCINTIETPSPLQPNTNPLQLYFHSSVILYVFTGVSRFLIAYALRLCRKAASTLSAKLVSTLCTCLNKHGPPYWCRHLFIVEPPFNFMHAKLDEGLAQIYYKDLIPIWH
jgi:hypothetical protein